jgi:outer membrane protein assembly factor BamB
VPARQRTTPAKEPVPAAAPPSAPTLDWGPLGDFFADDGTKGSETAAPESWQAPPVRGPSRAQANGVAAEPVAAPAPQLLTPKVARRRSWKLIGAMAGSVFLLTALVSWQYQRQRAGNETQRLEQAEERYRNQSFEDAASRYNSLARDFPTSPNQPLYRLAAELCGLREPVYRTQGEPEETAGAFSRLREFVAEHKGDPLLERYQDDLWDTFAKLSQELGDAAEQKHDSALAKLAGEALDQAVSFKPPEKPAPATRVTELRERLGKLNEGIATWQRKEAVLAQAKAVVEHFTFTGRQKAMQAVDRAGLGADPEVVRLLAELPAKHRASVTYHPASPAQEMAAPPDDPEPSLLIAPLLKAGPVESMSDSRLVLAVVSGVLYALEPGGSEVRWCRRVSLDSQALPVRVPRNGTSPELVLALTPDNLCLAALDAQRGTPVWHYRLKAACVGSPVVVGRRVFVATSQGYVEEIDTSKGAAVGYYLLGQPLTVGGARQPGSDLLYFPADSDTVYVLDVAAKKCAAVLYTDHPAGSLRCAPVIVAARNGQGDGHPVRANLVLSQDDGLDNLKLRVISLPAADNGRGPRQWQKSIRGWSWFPPYADSERLAQVTDAGAFGLYGLGSRVGEVLDVFPMVSEQNLASSPSGGRQPSEGRALVLHAGEELFWVLADGELHKLLLTFDRHEGPKLLQRPVPEPALGSALHAAQERLSVDGKTTLFLATQKRADQTALASAVDARFGIPVWQRQLGLLCRGQPVRVGNKMLVEDQGGSLYLFATAECKAPSRAWRQAGRKLPADDTPHAGPHYFLPGPGADSITVVTSLATQPPSVAMQVFQPGNDTPTASSFPQQGGLGGTPGLSADALVMPLSNGVLARQALAGGPAVSGPNWRVPHADVDAVGHVVALSKDDFLVTDGSRGLKRLRWPTGTMTETTAAAELANRIIAAPVVLSAAGGEVRICVADAANTVTLLQGAGLQPVRQWSLGGKITAGPFVRGKGIGCVVDRRRLVWLDPEKEAPAWSYNFAADIVGEPQLLGDDLLIVADLSGQFSGFDPRTGQVQGSGYTLKANVAPAAAPVSFAGRLFTPLTDRTILLLSVDHFRHPLLRMPLFW